MAVVTVVQSGWQSPFTYADYNEGGTLLRTYVQSRDYGDPPIGGVVGATSDYGFFLLANQPNLTSSFSNPSAIGGSFLVNTANFVNFRVVSQGHNPFFPGGTTEVMRGGEGTKKQVYQNLLSLDNGGTWFWADFGVGNLPRATISIVGDMFVAYRTVLNPGQWNLAISADGVSWQYMPLFTQGTEDRILCVGQLGTDIFVVSRNGNVYTAPSFFGPFSLLPFLPNPDGLTSLPPLNLFFERALPTYTLQGRSFIFTNHVAWSRDFLFEVTAAGVRSWGRFTENNMWSVQPHRIAFADGHIFYIDYTELMHVFALSDNSFRHVQLQNSANLWQGGVAHASFVMATPGSFRGSIPITRPPFWRDHTLTYETSYSVLSPPPSSSPIML